MIDPPGYTLILRARVLEYGRDRLAINSFHTSRAN
jgi:hypothetical protein